MSNSSLKEQLQALAVAPAATEVAPSKLTQQPFKSLAKPAKKSAWLEQAQYGVELLKAYFPLCFTELAAVQPLKLGIKQDLVIWLSTNSSIALADKACMVNSLAYYVNSPSYHKVIVTGTARIGLDGQPQGIVTEQEAQYSQDYRNTKLQKRNTSRTGSQPQSA